MIKKAGGLNCTAFLGACLIAGVLVVSGCVSNQPAPEVVEAGQATQETPQQNVEMIRALSQINELKEELKQLRNAVEEMQYAQGNSERRQQDLLQDIDRRLLALEDSEKLRSSQFGQSTVDSTGQVLEVGQTGTAGSTTNGVGTQSIGGAQELTQQEGSTGSPTSKQVDSVTVSNATQEGGVSVSGGTGSTSVSMTEQQAYESAFEMLKQSKYQDAIEQFQALVNTWPQSQLADDALYWMSEANYVNREFEAALNGFRAVVERYPDSSRLPEAMLKVGYIQYDIGAYEQAAETFQDILARFPGHQVTVAAETRLRRIQQTIQ